MGKTFKFKSLLIVLATSIFSISTSFATNNQKTVVTLYNDSAPGGGTFVVYRQVNQKIELLDCGKRYEGALNDSVAIKAFLKEIVRSDNCRKISGLGWSKNDSKNAELDKKFVIHNDDGVPVKYIYSGVFARNYVKNSIVTGGSTIGIDVYNGLEVSLESDILFTYMGINHESLENPTIFSGRVSSKLSGMALIEHPSIQD